MVLAGPIAVFLGVCALACESFSASNDVSNVTNEAGATDGFATADGFAGADGVAATDSTAPDAAANLFPLGDFEVGGCSGESYYSVLSPDSTAHLGSKSCRVCSDGVSPDVFSFDSDVDGVTPPLSARYSAEAWVRSADDAGAPAGGVELTLRTYTDAPVTIRDNALTARAPLTSAWQRLVIPLDITQSGMTKLTIVVDGAYETGTCFLVDDIVVRREK